MKELLLSYLADQRQGDTELCESAREFLLCQSFADEITKLQRAGASDEDQVAALVQYRETCDVLKRGASRGLTPGELAATHSLAPELLQHQYSAAAQFIAYGGDFGNAHPFGA